MRNWETVCMADGAIMPCDYVICNEAPDEEALNSCKQLGAALV